MQYTKTEGPCIKDRTMGVSCSCTLVPAIQKALVLQIVTWGSLVHWYKMFRKPCYTAVQGGGKLQPQRVPRTPLDLGTMPVQRQDHSSTCRYPPDSKHAAHSRMNLLHIHVLPHVTIRGTVAAPHIKPELSGHLLPLDHGSRASGPA